MPSVFDNISVAWPDGLRLNRLLTESTRTINDVAEDAGVSVPTIRRAIRGDRIMHRPNLEAVLRAIGKTTKDLGDAEPRLSQTPFARLPRVFEGQLGRVFAWLVDYYADRPVSDLPDRTAAAEALGITKTYLSACIVRLRKAKLIRNGECKPTKKAMRIYADYLARGEAAYAGLDC